MKFALVIDNQIKEFRDYDSQPDCKIINGLKTIRPVVEITDSYDANTQKLVQTEVIYDDKVEVRFVATTMTPDEINTYKQNKNSASEQLRASAYKKESDPLFFKAQRGESTIEEWLAKVAEIKSRFPKD